ncbi:MAG TPA: hypothetical protein VGQ41_09230 [Pyrinomonadaceae bacterium]|jgi:hypothetical protein|nr:hypothetical protein [Pyrinomonadaceae bacterium]
MKRCPICEKVYEYDSLRFCRFDGARLDDVSWREAPTILLEPDEGWFKPQIYTDKHGSENNRVN